jgi:putative heme-binding domain-containing protein
MRAAVISGLSAWAVGLLVSAAGAATPADAPGLSWSAAFVAEALADAREYGDARRGAGVFNAATSGCTACHKVAGEGGAVGPELTTIATCLTPEEIVESVYWPARTVKPEYRAFAFMLADGRVVQGVVREETPAAVVVVDATGKRHEIQPADIEERTDVGSLMPANVFTSLPDEQRRDLIRYLLELGRTPGLESLSHRPEPFAVPREPLRPDDWPNQDLWVNEHRIYDPYTKQSMQFRGRQPMPLLLPAFPGLDGGKGGHWGSIPWSTWDDDRRNTCDQGSAQCWPLAVNGKTVSRAVNVRLGDDGELTACFNPDTLEVEAVWTGGFLTFAKSRYGFLSPAAPGGQLGAPPAAAELPAGSRTYHGFYRHGKRVVFSYSIGDVRYLDAPWVKDGAFVREIAPADTHPLGHLVKGGPPQWPQVLTTTGSLGTAAPYAVDTITPPFDNPWGSLMFFGGHDFYANGDAAICTIQGDVWRVSGLDAALNNVRWRRIAAGLNQALGLVVHDDVVFVLCGDQLTRLDDTNGDGEIDFYACVTNRFEPSGGHNFKCGLERDAAGNFFTASHEGLLRISPDGTTVDVLAVGFRNPDGLGLLPDGTLTVPVSEGEWTPASAICEVRQVPGQPPASPAPNFRGTPPALPLAYLPRGLDHSSGGQTYVSSDRWGPLGGQMVHFSFGACTHFLVLRDEVGGQPQGAVVPLVGDFRSGVHRGRFSPADGQLYVSGMNGWHVYGVDDGCFQRVRYTGGPVQQPIGIRAHRNGVLLRFSAPLEGAVAGDAANHFAQCWNYRYGPSYGSPEFSPSHYGTVGHDPLAIRSATVLSDGQSLFLEIPDLQPVNTLHLHVAVGGGETRDVFATVHALDEPYREIPNYQEVAWPVAAHPILRDIAMLKAAVKNPWLAKIEGARAITIEAASNLAYKTPELRAQPGEKLALTFVNPDVVPHNWVLAKPGTLAAVGTLADALIADPEAVARHYVPTTDDVIAYADITEPGKRQTISFTVPDAPGRYPFLCTFPGHWKLMNGLLIVEGEEAIDVAARAHDLFRRDNLVAWCIVPFDAKQRGPEERAAMLGKLGFKHFAYDWRPEHVPTFAAEWDALAKHGVALDAFWSMPPDFPGLLASLRTRGLKPSFWVMINAPPELDQNAKVQHAAARVRTIAEEAAQAGCRVSIYNHGGWGGEPENMVAVCEAVNLPNVGIVYNQHHGHAHLPRFKEALAAMLPHLHFLNLNGMTADGDTQGKKILVLGQGDLDVELARIICASGYEGPIGILNHTGHDAETRLLDNLDGLDWITSELTGKPIPKPTPRTP